MANYDVSIKIAVAGAKELDRVNKGTEQLRKNIDFINNKAQKGTAGMPVVKNFKNLSSAVEDAKDALNDAAIGTKEFNQAVKNVVKVEDKFNRQLKIRDRALKVEKLRLKEGLTLKEAKLKVSQQERIAEEKLAASKEKTAKAEKRKRIGGAISSAAIGGAFPLLFGQSGAAATGGAIGGAAGGLIGGQFGFALSILGTAIGQFIQQQDELDKSLSKISRSFIKAGNSAGFTRESFNELKSTTRMTKDEVLSIAAAFARFGEAGESAAFIFGDNPNTFKNLTALRDTNTLMTLILDTQNGLSIEQQTQLLREAKLTNFKDMQLQLNRMILETNYRNAVAQAEVITRTERAGDVLKEYLKIMTRIHLLGGVLNPFVNLEEKFPDFFKDADEKQKERLEELEENYKKSMENLPKIQDMLTQLDREVEAMSYSIPSALDKVSRELRKLLSVGFLVVNMADTIGGAFEESFKGIVKGSMTAQEALRNLFMRTADAFLDMAAKILAAQIRTGILNLGLRMFSGGGPPLGPLGNPLSQYTTKFDPSMQRASGGPVTGGKSYLVGERGPEMFSPGVSGMITPNHALGGSTTVVVNVDASGSSVQGDEAEGKALGMALSAAIESELIKQKRPGGLLA